MHTHRSIGGVLRTWAFWRFPLALGLLGLMLSSGCGTGGYEDRLNQGNARRAAPAANNAAPANAPAKK